METSAFGSRFERVDDLDEVHCDMGVGDLVAGLAPEVGKKAEGKGVASARNKDDERTRERRLLTRRCASCFLREPVLATRKIMANV
eukprot:CAMPEP_0175951264 /NCGR_PEP_ID=MMETSP0108-20121206/30103_1 /TAXON_ID=195067 ORGANISM="Goniomonas pacifica, Strain CCMP1869" /NCGR_SAMPLE_ID=MMETSP0108 /ASSEMBLY_ACC=CAM_ASM_000204 /LENGTH=85 /DNA_ID=CAMNT_0017277503 /DNA_START=261 /DNA_END=518 /DNA_ORIENTATION=-